MADDLTGVPVPDLDDPMYAPFWRATAAGTLRLPRCADCGAFRWPSRVVCPACGSERTDWAGREAAGSLFTWTLVGHPTARGFTDVPYVVGIVELSGGDGVRMAGGVVGTDPAELVAGLPLRGVFRPAGADGAMTVLQWQPDTSRRDQTPG